MRVSTNMLYQTGVARISDLNTALNKTMQQISTNRRVLTPADDAVAAARALDLSQAQSVNAQYGVNRQNVKSSLNQEESVLQGVTSLLQSVKATLVGAGNGALSDTDRASIATELRGRFDELLGLANTTDGAGSYLFSGHQTATPAFARTAAGAQYQGDDGQRQLLVEASRQMNMSDTGRTIFQGNGAAGEDVFNTLQDVITLLETPVNADPGRKAALTAGLATANGNIDKSLNNVLTVRSAIGSRLNEIDALDDTGGARDILYQENIADLIGLDTVEAYSRLVQQKITLEAAQQAYVNTSRLSLFQFM
ncbi:MAG: flagellar hook-associated protein FlgL [Burkholderiaceae bacterium]